MHKITRISYNTADWRHPTGDARHQESGGTYVQQHGFGHEDWLFRSEWQIGGWRYAFLQGVNKGREKLLDAAVPFDVTLYVIQPKGIRSLVATIIDVECLGNQQASDAIDAFKREGWFDKMKREITDAGGDASALGDTKWAANVLNIRFRLDNVIRYPSDNVLPGGSWVQRFTRYQLQDIESLDRPVVDRISLGHRRSGEIGSTKPYIRKSSAAVECTPEHARMQTKLLAELRDEYPDAEIECECDFVDISVVTDAECHLFELKSDLNPRTVIRLALGQILEYAYHPNRRHRFPPQMHIVGRQALSDNERRYIEHLQTEFGLPLSYRVVKL